MNRQVVGLKVASRKHPPCETNNRLMRANLASARLRWGLLPKSTLYALKELTADHRVSVQAGDLLLLDACWYVTHTGLLHLARRSRCVGMSVETVPELTDTGAGRWAFKATVYTTKASKGFVGYGDADRYNVSPQVRGAEMRVTETRAVNRALRKAYGIGICSVEKLGSFSGPLPPAAAKGFAKADVVNGHGQSHPLRDRLCLLMRQHQLDPALVKAYAADYCDVSELRHASREEVATFIKHLAEYAQSDREGLRCQLNSYATKPVTAASEATCNDDSHPETRGAA